MFGGTQSPVTPAPGNLLSSSGLCRDLHSHVAPLSLYICVYMYRYVYVCTYTNTYTYTLEIIKYLKLLHSRMEDKNHTIKVIATGIKILWH